MRLNATTVGGALSVWLSIVSAMPGGRAALRDYLSGGGQLLRADPSFRPATISELFDPVRVIGLSDKPAGLGLPGRFRK